MANILTLCKQIRSDLNKDWSEEISDHGLTHIFQSVLNLQSNIADKNRIICYIAYAYSPDSLWLDLKQDRLDNKLRILHNLDADTEKDLYKSILNNSHEVVNISIFNFLESLKTWKWRAIFELLEFASKMSRFASAHTPEEKSWDEFNKDGNKQTLKEDIDPAVVLKINKDKGLLLEESFQKREKADRYIEEVKKEFVSTDLATQSDFGFQLTETAKKIDKLSWRAYIKDRNENKLNKINA